MTGVVLSRNPPCDFKNASRTDPKDPTQGGGVKLLDIEHDDLLYSPCSNAMCTDVHVRSQRRVGSGVKI